MIVSGSELATLNECEMRYYFQYVLGLAPRDQTIPIQTGNAGHTNNEQFFRAIQNGATKEEALQAIVPVNNSAHALKAAYLATKFCEKFNVNSGKPILVEEKLIVPFDGKVKKGITPDLVWEYKSGVRKLIDHKFTERSWSDEGAELHHQLPSYQYHLNENFEYRITGSAYIFFNTRDNAKQLYRIKPLTISDEEAKNVVEDQKKALDRVIEFRENPVAYTHLAARRVNNVHVCTYCPFRTPCRFDRQGKDITATLALQYTKNTYGYGEDADD